MANALPPLSAAPSKGDSAPSELDEGMSLSAREDIEGRNAPLVRPKPLLRPQQGAPAAPRAMSALGIGPSSAGPAAPLPIPRAGTIDTNPAGESRGRPSPGAYLSPRMTAVFGGIFGLATITSIIALLIQVVPVRDERSLTSKSAAPAGKGEESPAEMPEVKKPKRVAIPGPWRISEMERDPSVTIAQSKMERRSFVDALSEKGVPKAQAYRIMKAFEGIRKFDKTGRRDRFTVALDRTSQRVRAFEYEVSPTEIYQAREGSDGLLTGAQLDMKLAENEITGAFYVGRDLTASYQAAGLEDGVLNALDDAMNGRLSTESFEEGGTVRLIAVEETALGLFARYKRIAALEYRPADPAGKPVRFYYFNGQESKGYFDEKGKQPYGGGWQKPCPGSPITSKFNPKRLHPILKKVMPHNGTDFGANAGTPVYSVYRGTVQFVGMAGPSGNLVTVLHPNGVETGYAHLLKFATGIKVGDKVGARQLVGYVGSTGRSTAPHLHFSAKKDGKFFDPETLQMDAERVMPVSDRPAFAALKEELDKRLDAIPLPEPPPEAPKSKTASAAGEKTPDGAKPAASAAAAPSNSGESGIHPSQFTEEAGDDDEDVGGESLQGAALGGPPPSNSSKDENKDSKNQPKDGAKPDPAEEEDDSEQ